MKIISLNTLMGTVFEPLMGFVEAQASTTDVFCFQEMMGVLEEGKEVTTAKGRRVNLFQELQKRLPGFEACIAQTRLDFETDIVVNGRSWFGAAIFVRKGITIEREEAFVFGENTRPDKSEVLAYGGMFVDLGLGEASLRVCGAHGVAGPGEKLDTPQRLAQSQTVLDAVNDAPGEVVIMGDFNLMPDTESVRLIERAGFRNLIKEFHISTTRGTLHKTMNPEYGHPPFTWQEFADYTFVSPGVKVTSFTVPDEPISDHLPMILECEIAT